MSQLRELMMSDSVATDIANTASVNQEKKKQKKRRKKVSPLSLHLAEVVPTIEPPSFQVSAESLNYVIARTASVNQEKKKQKKRRKKDSPLSLHLAEVVPTADPFQLNASTQIQAQLNASTQSSPIGSKRLFVGNLSYGTEKKHLLQFFKKKAEDIDIKLALDHNCDFIGCGHVKFPTEADAQKALELNGQILLGNKVKVAYVCPPPSQDWRIYIEGFDKSLEAYEIERSVKRRFQSCGEIIDVRILRSSVVVEFLEQGSVSRALLLDGSDLMGYQISVGDSHPSDQ